MIEHKEGPAEALGDLLRERGWSTRVLVQSFHWDARRLRRAQVEQLKEAGYLVRGFTVNDDLGLLGARAIGLDGVTTDIPAHAKALLAGTDRTTPEADR